MRFWDFARRKKPRNKPVREVRSSRAAKNGSRGNAPCRVKGQRPLWGLGQRPNCSTSNLLKRKSQQGAGSEASLPVTSRVLRRASKLLFPTPVLCRAKWARPDTTKGDTHTMRYASKDYRKVARQMLRHHPILLLLTLLLALDDIDTPEEAETAAPKEA